MIKSFEFQNLDGMTLIQFHTQQCTQPGGKEANNRLPLIMSLMGHAQFLGGINSPILNGIEHQPSVSSDSL